MAGRLIAVLEGLGQHELVVRTQLFLTRRFSSATKVDQESAEGCTQCVGSSVWPRAIASDFPLARRPVLLALLALCECTPLGFAPDQTQTHLPLFLAVSTHPRETWLRHHDGFASRIVEILI